MSTKSAMDQCKTKYEKGAGNQQLPPISANVIKINNFILYGSTGCVMPYLSVYFLHYTQASSSDVGGVMLISSFMSILISLLLSSIADRYQAYRLVYLFSLFLAYTSYLTLAIPIIVTSASNGNIEDINSDDIEPQTVSELQSEYDHLNSTPLTPEDTSALFEFASDDLDDQQWTKIDQYNAAWFYLISVCIAIGNMSSVVNMSYTDSFSANVARMQQGQRQQANELSGFGSLRFFGSIGWCVASLSLSIISAVAPNLPYLLAPWLLFLLMATSNILLVLFWPDKRPFDLTISSETEPSPSLGQGDVGDARGARKSGASRWTRNLILSRHSVGQVSLLSFDTNTSVELVDYTSYSFDEIDVDALAARRASQSVRRCSIAPLGNSYICEHYVISNCNNNSNKDSDCQMNAFCSGPDSPKSYAYNTQDHFKYIVKIEPIRRNSQPGIELSPLNIKDATIVGERETQFSAPLNSVALDNEDKQRLCEHEELESDVVPDVNGREPLAPIDLQLYLKIIVLIARRNRNVLRFMWLYTMIGFIASMNLIYLFPYLESLDSAKFETLAPQVMISCYLSETVFYYFSPQITSKLSPANGLTFVLLVYASRYLLYLTFANWSANIWPLELIIAVELMQSISFSWFECIINESALEFALEAEHCVPELIELKLIANTPDSIDQVKSSVKLALFSVSSCCFDGIGIGFGSLAGGWLIHNYSYSVLWSSCAALALTVGLANLLLELTFFRSPLSRSARLNGGIQLARDNDSNKAKPG